jgi:SPP1 family holin
MKKNINFAGVTPETWARTIVLFIALINQILAIMGKGQIEIAESDIYQICSLVFTVISTIWAWWKNNSFSVSAQDGDKVMKALESGELEYTEKTNPHTTDHYHGVG